MTGGSAEYKVFLTFPVLRVMRVICGDGIVRDRLTATAALNSAVYGGPGSEKPSDWLGDIAPRSERDICKRYQE